MRRMLHIALAYALAAMAGGVFYREFTRAAGFSGQTSLSLVHTHLFLLGMVVFLLAGLYVSRLKMESDRRFRAFLVVYNLGVPLTAAMLFTRGLLQVQGTKLSAALDASLSGVAGLGHVLTGVGLLLLLLSLMANCGKR